MKSNRRNFLKTIAVFGVAPTLLSCKTSQKLDQLKVDYKFPDEIQKRLVLKRELFKVPVYIERVQ